MEGRPLFGSNALVTYSRQALRHVRSSGKFCALVERRHRRAPGALPARIDATVDRLLLSRFVLDAVFRCTLVNYPEASQQRLKPCKNPARILSEMKGNTVRPAK